MSATIGQLTIENGIERLALYGSHDITRDKVGLLHAQALNAIIDQALTADPALPGRQPPVGKRKTVRNPFT
jgi:hypothetical protein